MDFGIGAIFSTVTNLIGGWFKNKQEIQKANAEMKLAELKNKARLLIDKETNNHAWEMANLVDKDKWLRRISFGIFAAPFFVAIFAPEHVAIYFKDAIGVVPEWWQKTFVAIIGGIWGLSSLKNILPGIISAFKNK